MDDQAVRAAAEADPSAFVRHDSLLMIDEIQRVPELLLAIKREVDRDTRPGRFLLTGSARLLELKDLPDALPGRTETIESPSPLWPLGWGPWQLSSRWRTTSPCRGRLSRYLDLLELIFVIKRIPAWSSNLTTRAISTPKLIVTDSGLGGRLIGSGRAREPTAKVGRLLRTSRSARPSVSSPGRRACAAHLFHYRD